MEQGNLVILLVIVLIQYAAAQNKDFCRNLLDGNYADPYDCEKYIVCAAQSGTVMWCPPGLHFHEKTNQCDWPSTVNCKPKPRPAVTTRPPVTTSFPAPPICARATRPGLYPDPKICSKYYQCDGKGNGKELSCPSKTNFHPGYNICVWEGTFTCQGQNFCQGKKDGNYQNMGDCSKFYSCSGELSYIMDCPTGLYYDETRDECDYPENVQCSATTLPPKPVPTRDTSLPYKSTAAPTSKPASQFCTGKSVGHYPDAVSCTKFYVCDGYGKGREEECPPKQNFFPGLGVCVWAYTYSCTATNFCINKQDGNYENMNNCGTFYACANGLTHVMKCPSNLYYNKNTDRCDFPKNVACKGQPTKAPTVATSAPKVTTSAPTQANAANKREVLLDMLDSQFADLDPPSPSLCKGRAAGSYQDPLSCQKFVVCDGSGDGVVKECPKHTNYHPKYRICVWAYLYSCSDPNFCVDKEDGNYKNVNNCFSYYACSGKLTYSMNCPKGLHFDGKDCVNSGKFECDQEAV